jgi:predicted ATPase with chaperone activity
MLATASQTHENTLAVVLSDESFFPAPPATLEEAGLSASFVEMLVCKYLSIAGTSSGRSIAEHVCLPFGILDPLFQGLRTKQLMVHNGSAALNDYYYALTEMGRERVQTWMRACGYVGPAPVPINDYVLSVEAQSIRAEAPRREQLEKAFADISVDPGLFESLGPAVNSGAGMFLYGAPGNGKSTIARRITMCFGQHIWIPQSLIEDGQIIKLYDNAYHNIVKDDSKGIYATVEHDRRWLKIRRPTVVVGGELTMDNLEIRHDPHCNVGEAPLQMKSNCGCLLIDDFGRQRIEPTELLNRWIVPLENRHDFLTLSTGKKIQVPFEQLVIFSTNLEPSDLVDDAFLRRIPYKIKIDDPSEEEFQGIIKLYAKQFDCPHRPDVVDLLMQKHYKLANRPMRRCQPRDLLFQIQNFCRYNNLPMEMRPEYFDHVVKSYFTVVLGK